MLFCELNQNWLAFFVHGMNSYVGSGMNLLRDKILVYGDKMCSHFLKVLIPFHFNSAIFILFCTSYIKNNFHIAFILFKLGFYFDFS